MPKVLLTHPGTQYSHQLAKQLFKRNLLLKFITGFTLNSANLFVHLIKIISPSSYRKISNRILLEVPRNKVIHFLVLEIASSIYFIRNGYSEDSYFRRNLQFQEKVSKSIIHKASAVIGFDTSSWILIDKSKQLNVPYILDVSIAHSESKNYVYSHIASKYPAWGDTLELKQNSLLDVEQYELKHSTHIVVASNFSKSTLIEHGIAENKVTVNPYGIDLLLFPLKSSFLLNGKIRFVFIGLVDARKGVPFLLDVFYRINSDNALLTIAGPIQEKIAKIINAEYALDNIQVLGKLPHNELPILLQQNDVFIFPTYFEGFGLVILEAMASGLPVITTTATAGPDIIEHGKEGFIIEPGDKKGLTDAIQYFIDNPHQIEIMGRAAREKAEQYSWDAYGDRWEKIIYQVIEKANG